MTIEIVLTPEEEERLREQAAQRGASPQELAAQYLRAHLLLASRGTEAALLPVRDEHGVFHAERLEAVHQFFDRASQGLPSIPLEALRREAMYEDHD
jgi:hypothetical protein